MARSFTSAADRAQNTAIPAVASTGTISYWIKPNFNSGNGVDIFPMAWAATVNNSSANGRIQVERYSDNNFYVGAYNMDGSTDHRLSFADTGIFVSGVWAHHALTWDQPNTTTRYFVNGVQKGVTLVRPAITFTVPCTVATIGNTPSGWGANAVANCSIADVGFYSVVLTNGEIVALAGGARPFTVRPASLKWFLPIDGISSPEPDLSGNAANATLTGTAYAGGPPVNMLTPRRPQFLIPSAAAVAAGATLMAQALL